MAAESVDEVEVELGVLMFNEGGHSQELLAYIDLEVF